MQAVLPELWNDPRDPLAGKAIFPDELFRCDNRQFIELLRMLYERITLLTTDWPEIGPSWWVSDFCGVPPYRTYTENRQASPRNPDEWLAKVKDALLHSFETRRMADHPPWIQPALIPIGPAGVAIIRSINELKLQIAALSRQVEWKRPHFTLTNAKSDRVISSEKRYYLNFDELIRQLIILPANSESVSYFWKRVFATRLLTVSQLRIRLLRNVKKYGFSPSSDSKTNELQRLDSLPDDEVIQVFNEFGIVPAVNVGQRKPDGSLKNSLKYAPMPIFVEGSTLPKFRPLKHFTHRRVFRPVRCDSKTLATPLLATLPAYRFREEFREEKKLAFLRQNLPSRVVESASEE